MTIGSRKRSLGALDHLPGDLGLLVGVGEDHRAVLVADVGPLAVELRGVVDLEVLRDELLVAHLRGVEGDLADLDVAGRAAADLLVGGVVDVAALIADGGVDDAWELLEGRLDLPEAAGAEGRLLGPRLRVVLSCWSSSWLLPAAGASIAPLPISRSERPRHYAAARPRRRRTPG